MTAAPITTNRVSAIRKSRPPVRAASRNTCCRTKRPVITMITMAISPSNRARSTVCTMFTPVSGDRKLTKIRIGATSMSWKRSTPSAVRPAGVAARCSLVSTCMTMAVDDRASARPITAAACPLTPNSQRVVPISVALRIACSPPAPNTILFMSQSFSNESSRPSRKSRNRTPSSAKGAAASGSETVRN